VVVIPGIDLTIQRDVQFEFLGPDFATFMSGDPATIKSFNDTVTQRLNTGSICDVTWLYKWFSGSIVSDFRMTYPAGTTQQAMDDDVNNVLNNAANVFGDLSSFGVIGVRGNCLSNCGNGDDGDNGDDDDNNALAIGLGVGLGVGIPLIAGIIFFCIWKKRRSDQNVAPTSQSA